MRRVVAADAIDAVHGVGAASTAGDRDDAAGGRRVLYVSGEESAEQIRLRADRITDRPSDLLVLCETDIAGILAAVRHVEHGGGGQKVDVAQVDSIIALAFVMVQRRARSRSDRRLMHVQSIISRRQLQW